MSTAEGLARAAAVEAVKSEREYARRVWGERQPSGALALPRHSLEEYWVYMRHYQRRAEDMATTAAGDEMALGMIRRIGGLAVSCLVDVFRLEHDDIWASAAGDLTVAATILRIHGSLADTPGATVMESLLHIVSDVLRCLAANGARCRDLDLPIYNRRDGMPA